MNQQLFSRYLMSLPDAAFFDLYRTYLGPIKTPFKKQSLVRDMQNLLRDQRVRQHILSLLSHDDRKWLSIIGLSGSMPAAQLTELFSHELAAIDIHQRVLNLEDRLLIISHPDTGDICLNPILRDMLFRYAIDTAFILPHADGSSPHKGDSTADTPFCSVTTATLFTMLAFFSNPQRIFKQSGSLKKRDHDRLGRLFPGVTGPGILGSALESLINALETLYLIRRQEDTGVSTEAVHWQAFFSLPHSQRLSFLAAAMVTSEPDSITEAASCVRGLIQLLSPGKRYHRSDLHEAVHCIHAAAGRRHSPWTADITRALETLGVLKPSGQDTLIASACDDSGTESPNSLVIQPSFEVTITDMGDPAGFIPLAGLLEPVRCDVYPLFELTRDRCIHSFVHSPHSTDRLKEFNTGDMPQNVEMSIELWQSESRSLSLYSGIVLVADDERRHIIEHHQQLSHHIDRILAPGVYLLTGDLQNAQEALQSAGLGYVPDQSSPSPHPTAYRQHRPVLHPLPEGPFTRSPHVPGDAGNRTPTAPDFTDQIQQKIRDEYHREQLLNRSRQKLLLLPEQISPDFLPNERHEARGLDYLGKVRLLERILQSSSDLAEVTERDRSGKPVRRLVRPTKLNPRGPDLYLSGLLVPGGDPVFLQVKKLSLVRRVRSGFNSRLL